MHQVQATARTTHRIKGAGLNQRVNGALVTHRRRHLIEEVSEGCESPFFLAGFNNCLHHVGTNVTDSSQAKADIIPHSGKGCARLINIRW